VLHGRGEDSVDGDVVAKASMAVDIDYLNGRAITQLTIDPDDRGVAAHLIGQPASARLREALDEQSGSLSELLLDEIPVTTLISGYALALSGTVEAFAGARTSSGGPPRKLPIGVCAGWEAEGVMALSFLAGEPVLRLGPKAPLDDDLAALTATSMRRRRRLDVRLGAPHVVDAMFRDTYFDDDLGETLVHEYRIAATVDAERRSILTIEATPGVLPGPECPTAAASAARLVGQSLSEVRAHVRAAFVGTSTCTHLNDALRALGDLDALLN